MARVKRSVAARKKRRKVLEQAKGYYGRKSTHYRYAKEQVEHSLVYAYRDRRNKKRTFRSLWIIRINAAARANGLSYNQFMHGLQRRGDRARPQVARRPRGLRSGGVRRGRREGQGRAAGRRRRQGRLTLPSRTLSRSAAGHWETGRVITSRDNETLKLVRKLLGQRKHRDETGLFAAEGEDLVDAARVAGIEPVHLLSAGETVEAELLATRLDAAASRARDRRLPARRPADGCRARRASRSGGSPIPGNVGTLVRTADAFGACVALSDGCADPLSPKALRASAGAIFRVPLVGWDAAPGRTVALVAHGGAPLADVDLAPPVTFLLGAERAGLPDELATDCHKVTIALPGAAESLNVAAAGAIALYEASRRARVAGLTAQRARYATCLMPGQQLGRGTAASRPGSRLGPNRSRRLRRRLRLRRRPRSRRRRRPSRRRAARARSRSRRRGRRSTSPRRRSRGRRRPRSSRSSSPGPSPPASRCAPPGARGRRSRTRSRRRGSAPRARASPAAPPARRGKSVQVAAERLPALGLERRLAASGAARASGGSTRRAAPRR